MLLSIIILSICKTFQTQVFYFSILHFKILLLLLLLNIVFINRLKQVRHTRHNLFVDNNPLVIPTSDVDIVLVPVFRWRLQGLSLNYQRRGVRCLAFRRHDDVFCPEKTRKVRVYRKSLILFLSCEIKSRNALQFRFKFFPHIFLLFFLYNNLVQYVPNIEQTARLFAKRKKCNNRFRNKNHSPPEFFSLFILLSEHIRVRTAS